MPLVIRPDTDDTRDCDFLIHWISENRQKIDSKLHQAGVLLIRGFEINTPDRFRKICATIRPNLRNYIGGDSPRHDVADQIYTSTEYPAHLEVLLHNELSYAGWSPEVVFFGCMVPPAQGGETHIADGRQILEQLDDSVKQRFQEKGVTYQQHLWDKNGRPGAGKSWQETFETDSRTEVEDYLTQSDMQFQWTDDGLKTAATHPAVLQHPITSEKCWHNQADQWHRDMPSVKNSVSAEGTVENESKTSTFDHHVTFGDGSEISLDDLYHIREVSKQCETMFPWETGDLMIIDNVLAMHGRKSFTGERKIIVAMA